MRGGQTHPHRPRLVVSFSTCPIYGVRTLPKGIRSLILKKNNKQHDHHLSPREGISCDELELDSDLKGVSVSLSAGARRRRPGSLYSIR